MGNPTQAINDVEPKFLTFAHRAAFFHVCATALGGDAFPFTTQVFALAREVHKFDVDYDPSEGLLTQIVVDAQGRAVTMVPSSYFISLAGSVLAKMEEGQKNTLLMLFSGNAAEGAGHSGSHKFLSDEEILKLEKQTTLRRSFHKCAKFLTAFAVEASVAVAAVCFVMSANLGPGAEASAQILQTGGLASTLAALASGAGWVLNERAAAKTPRSKKKLDDDIKFKNAVNNDFANLIRDPKSFCLQENSVQKYFHSRELGLR